MKKEDQQNQIIVTKPDGMSSFAWRQLQQQIVAMLGRYGEAADFLAIFTPALQLLAASEWRKAYTGTAPTLTAVWHGYGKETALVWICLELEDLNLFAGVKEKMNVKLQKELSQVILVEYGHLKVTELLLFFHRLKCGRYGRFYGSVDALFISASLLSFMDERKRELAYIAEEQERMRQETPPLSKGITYAEYLERKRLREEQPNKKGGQDEPR